jgi:hypothetical protein
VSPPCAAPIASIVLLLALSVGAARAATLPERVSRSPLARVTVGGRTFLIEHPRLDDDGLSFEHVTLTAERLSRTEPHPSSSWGMPDEVEMPESPIPWAQVERLDASIWTRRTTLILGTLVGGVAALAARRHVHSVDVGGARVGRDGLALGMVLVGAGLGATVQTLDWQQVHPPPGDRRNQEPPPVVGAPLIDGR